MKIYKGLIGMAVMLLLCGCSNTQIENREFPAILTVTSESDFASEWLNGLQEGNKKIDYNHLKVVLIERAFLEKEEAMTEMLTVLKADKNVPLNAYVVTTENVKELTETKLSEPLGDYLEKLLEKGDSVKKETYPTIGLLYQEEENRMETLFIPCISLVEEKPTVASYEVYKRGIAKEPVETDSALLAFFLANEMKDYVLELEGNRFVELSNSQNEIDFEWERMENGLLKKQVIAEVHCDGRLLVPSYGQEKEEIQEQLEVEIYNYMTGKASHMLTQGIDVTNSYKKLGREPEWYAYYAQNPDFYEGEIEIFFDLDIEWTD